MEASWPSLRPAACVLAGVNYRAFKEMVGLGIGSGSPELQLVNPRCGSHH